MNSHTTARYRNIAKPDIDTINCHQPTSRVVAVINGLQNLTTRSLTNVFLNELVTVVVINHVGEGDVVAEAGSVDAFFASFYFQKCPLSMLDTEGVGRQKLLLQVLSKAMAFNSQYIA